MISFFRSSYIVSNFKLKKLRFAGVMIVFMIWFMITWKFCLIAWCGNVYRRILDLYALCVTGIA